MKLTRFSALLLAPLFAFKPAAPTNGEEVLRMMHDKYAGKWYTSMSFTQKTTLVGGAVQTWYETMSLPRILRIDIAPLDSGNASLYHNDTAYSFRGGALRRATPSINPLLVLGFDVYTDTVAATVRRMKTFNIDFTKVSANTWQGKPHWVVGAMPGDSTSPQFWVDQEHLLFTRMFAKSPNGSVTEYQFNKYSPIGGGWISAEVLFYTNGQPGNKEEYTNIKIGEKFAPDFFEPSKFTKRTLGGADPDIDAVRARFLLAFAKKDTAVLRERLTDDAITWFKQGGGGAPNVGLPAILGFYGGLFSGALRAEMLFTPQSLAREANAATETGTFTMPGPGISGVYTTLYQRGADGRWRIAFWKAGPA